MGSYLILMPICGSKASQNFQVNFGPNTADVRPSAPMIANNHRKSTPKICTHGHQSGS